MIHEPNTIEWKTGDIVIADCDAKKHKMLMVVVGETVENGVRILKTKYLNPLEMIQGQPSPSKMSRWENIWLNEIKYLHNPDRFEVIITEHDKEKAKEMIKVEKKI